MFWCRTFGLDLEGGATKGEQRGVEHDSSVAVERHVHGDETFASDAMRTQLAKAEWGRDFTQQRHHIQMLDFPSIKSTTNKCTFDTIA